jgi:hypothetical protein
MKHSTVTDFQAKNKDGERKLTGCAINEDKVIANESDTQLHHRYDVAVTPPMPACLLHDQVIPFLKLFSLVPDRTCPRHHMARHFRPECGLAFRPAFSFHTFVPHFVPRDSSANRPSM